jgi:transposase
LLLAALDTQTGEVIGQAVPRHTSAVFVDFLADVVATQPRRKEIHLILDNLSTHKTTRVAQFLAVHPHVHLHFTPTSASWLNQIELWFSKLERDLIARGIFRSVGDLRRKIMRDIRHGNQAAHPIRWVYRQPDHRITLTTASDVTGH